VDTLVKHWAALVAYDGTDFKGFQRQSAARGRTVQGEIEASLAQIIGVAVPVVGAGRTDAGVHATGQVIGFASTARMDAVAWRGALNAALPPDVAVRAVAAVDEAFHARKSALARRYRYRLFVDPVRAPLVERYAWRVPRLLDVAAMNAAAALLVGEHDFGAFGSSPRDSRAHGYRGHTVRTIVEARCRRAVGGAPGSADAGEAQSGTIDDMIECVFAANAFLTGMVRRLVGTLVLVGQESLTVDAFRTILEAADKAHPGAAAPAHGLCLAGVDYPAGAVSWPTGTIIGTILENETPLKDVGARDENAREGGETHESEDL
jgi:tRNA pseudouridine38-40 synthase